MTWVLLAWSTVAALAAIAVGFNLRRRDQALAGPGTAGWHVSSEAEALCDRMLALLDRQDPRLAKVALLRWVGGLSAQRAADVLAVPVAQIERDSETARAVLRRADRR